MLLVELVVVVHDPVLRGRARVLERVVILWLLVVLLMRMVERLWGSEVGNRVLVVNSTIVEGLLLPRQIDVDLVVIQLAF